MKVSLKWLHEYVDIKLNVRQLAERLTMAGLEVRGVETTGGTWSNIVVGEVVAVDPHPNADRLKLATVNLGTERLTVVCGAPNIAPGQKVPFAHVGARLVDGHTGEPILLKPANIRGVISEGMVCSERELGISSVHEGIMVLPDEAPVGAPLGDYLGDAILDVDVTPNRPDCLSVIGIAREIGALTGQRLRLPQVHYEQRETPIHSFVSVAIVEPDLCPRYCASLITGIKVGPSPTWLQQRLNSYGMRPINNVVDVTNYVMLEYGQPLHAFDYQKLKGRQIIVRRANSGETITTLDGSKRTLNPDILVIADGREAVAVAGIMGGLDSEVTGETNVVLLESANFNQAAIRRACNHLRVQSEASIRFDKGLSPELPPVPLKRATRLLLEIAGGKAADGIIDVYPNRSEPKAISVSVSEVKRLSGLEVSSGEILQAMEALGFDHQGTSAGAQISVSVPYWRSDIRCSADLVEEVVRILGYDRIPMAKLASPLPAQRSSLSPEARRSDLKERLRSIFTGFGFQEILTYSLVSLERLEKLSSRSELLAEPLKVANPMSKEQEFLRTSLRCGLLSTLAHNQRFEQGPIRLFEIGKVFQARRRDLPEEKEMLCALLSGSRTELSWLVNREMVDFFDAKGIVESLLCSLGVSASFENSDDDGLFPGRAANIIAGDAIIGVVGELHPRVAQAYELSSLTYLMDVDLEKLLPRIGGISKYQTIPRFPSVYRDIALLVDEQVSYGKVENIIRGFPLVAKVTLFDLYRGEQVPKGKKSFAIRIVYQSPSHTLTDEEVGRVQDQMLTKLHKELSATLRT